MPSVAAPVRLAVQHLTVKYGGVTAVDNVTLDVPPRRVTGLIGPNGAGKSTTFAAATGLLRPAAGTVLLADHDVTGAPPYRRAQLGLGRTFQRAQLFESLTVADNVAMGKEALLSGASPWRHLRGGRSAAKEVAAARDDALDLCELGHLRGTTVRDLSTGQRRLVELARVVAGGFSVLLLDEPSSGLDHAETTAFGEVLRTLVRERGVGILLVEHDMSLVMSVCEYIFVIDFGRPIFDGTPQQTQASDIVRAAYLGDDA